MVGSDRCGGQALVLGLFFVFAVAAVLLLMFNTGGAVSEKLRITNAADAATWSVATIEARALNYDAYANRAIVANQVAIAQAVSLVSWLHYFESARHNAPVLASVLSSWIYDPAEYPRLARLLATVAGAAYLEGASGGAAQTVTEGLDRVLGAIITAHDAASTALSASQSLMHASLATGIAQGALANQLVRRVDPAMKATINPLTHGFARFTHALTRSGPDGDARGRLADVVSRSLDDFTRHRAWSIRGPNLPPLQRKVALKRRGGTELIGYDEWRAMDTLENQGKRMKRWRWRWRRTPLAAGAATIAASGQTSAQRGTHGGSYADNTLTSFALAEPGMINLDTGPGRFGGLPSTRELRELEDDATQTSGVTIRTAKTRTTLRISGGSSVVQPGGRLRQFDAPAPGGEMSALARAEVFFAPPTPRADRKDERPSLYSPYWQARLIEPTPADRAWAASHHEGRVLP
jgi:hypothetical protein